MFSEYASRFLQHSNTRFTSPDDSQHPLDRRRPSGSRYVQRQGVMPGPYQPPSASQSRFPFAGSRLLRRQDQPAPLFFSATDDFRDDDNDDHEREVADFYALQKSRQQFGPSNLTESSEMDDGRDHDQDETRGRTLADSRPQSEAGGKARLVDVNLASTIHEGDEPTSADALLPEERPLPFQTFRTPGKETKYSSFLPRETDEEAQLQHPRPPSPDRESAPPTVILPTQEPPKHDAFFASLYQISLFAMFAAFILIWFHTPSPSSGQPLGDTVYSALRSSTYMLLWDTVLAVVVAMIWQALLKHYVRPLMYSLIVIFPIVLFTFSLYPFISSFQPSTKEVTLQDQVMRYLAIVPFVMAVFFVFSAYRWRFALHKSIGILEFSTRVLATSPYLMISGFVSLAANVTWTWIWLLMFERLFLSGHFNGAKKFLIDANAWWLAAYFFLEYLWTLGVIAGVQRATTAATVSQWYFHRFQPTQPSSRDVVKASFLHATGALAGTVCLSTLLSLLVRLPLIILPGRLSGILNMCAYWLIPTSLATLTNPLTLTYAAIHSQPLGIAARGVATLNFVSRTNPSNTLGPRNFNPIAQSDGGLVPYRLSKLLLQTTRWLMSFALGFGGWVRTAHQLELSSAEGTAGIRGSLYAYVVALIAGTIGFAVLGAVENVVSGILDATVVCWASETAGGRGEARYCREAGEMFGGEGET
ncbi:hypothetical protein AMS68_007459 [Peltaster fructicola]|uniref:Protein PNS1 n=1 Tax=Peltaster fructicola TaxID=286661 RepID=A0A6H0Y4I8_9PEZI|nr:hypothetical protein AMS68_007459 [Peltaster fructicola]